MRLTKDNHNATVRIQLEVEINSHHPLYYEERMDGYTQDYWIRDLLEQHYRAVLAGNKPFGDSINHDCSVNVARGILSAKRTRVLTKQPGDLIHRPDHRLADGSTVRPPGEGGTSHSGDGGGSVGSSKSARVWDFALA